MIPTLAVIGGGGFGMAVARAAAHAGTSVVVWSRREHGPAETGIEVTRDFALAARAETLVLAVPSPHAAEILRELGRHLDGRHCMAHVSRGLVAGQRGRVVPLTRLITALTPVRRVGVLAGPFVPEELARGLPGGGVVGTHFPELVDALRSTLGGAQPRLRLYESSDMLGVELASALTGALLFTYGHARAMGLSPSVLAILATRGLAEITRVGVAMGARASTFAGLAGAGELIAATAGGRRPEIALGEMVAAGMGIDQALTGLGAHVESAKVATLVADYAKSLGTEAPIAATVGMMLAGGLTGEQALERLLTRRVGHE